MDDLRALWHTTADLFSEEEPERGDAGLELAEASLRFSESARDVVDDKLSFSATLMRAGEVAAAHQLLAEVEQDVRSEQAALMETVNEVKVRQAVRRERITRKRLARTLVTAVLGSSLMAFSAVGMAVAGMLQEHSIQTDGVPTEVVAPHTPATFGGAFNGRDRIVKRRLNKVRIGSLKVALDDDQLEAFRKIEAGAADPATVEQFLQSLPNAVARHVRHVIASTTTVVASAPKTEVSAPPLLAETVSKATDTKKRKKKKVEKAKAADKPEPQPEPEPSPSPSPSDPNSEDGDSSGENEKSGDGIGLGLSGA